MVLLHLQTFLKRKKKRKKKCFAALKMCLLDEGHGEIQKNAMFLWVLM